VIDSVSNFSDLALSEQPVEKNPEQSEIEQAARQFEAMLLQVVIKEMRKTVPEGMFSGTGTDVFQDLFDQELSTQMLEEGAGLGLADSIISNSRSADQSMHSLPPALQAYGAQGSSKDHTLSDVLPVEGRVSSVFGSRKDPIRGTERDHHGLDIAAPEGTDIRAVRDGVVRFADERGGYGQMVIVDHGEGLETRYAHCSELIVREGEKIRAGERIALVGSTGRSTGPHLHFEARQDGNPVDPQDFFGW
jgi:murein DD-endopeptidase MepM/ murein hydrolase activator NlpD